METPASHQRDPDDWWWIFDPRQSLRARAVVIFGGLALGASLLLGWTAESLFRRHLSLQLGPAFETLAVQIGDKLDRALDERLRALQFVAGLAATKNPATTAIERRAVLEALRNAGPDCAWIGFADRDGRVVSATQRLLEGASVADSAWFRGARRSPYTGNLHESPELASESSNLAGDNRLLDLAVPVTDTDGNFLGVIGAQVRWSWARDTQNSVVPESARSQHIGVTLYASDGDVLLDTGATGWTRPPNPPAIGDKPGARGHLVESVPGDTNFFTGYFRTKGFREFRGARWLVTVRQPEPEAFALARDLRRWIVGAGVVLTALVVLLSGQVAGRITRRMAAITTAAERIRGGDVLTLMPRATGRDELQSMCGALGDLVEDQRQKQEALERENLRLQHERSLR